MNFAILGAGAWGTAMAVHLVRCGHTVTLVPRRFEQALALASSRENADYLPGIRLPDALQVAHELAPVLLEAEVLLFACPSHALRATAAHVQAARGGAARLRLAISLVKGLEGETHLRPSQVIAAELPGVLVGALAGPTYAAELARGLPAAMVLAAELVPGSAADDGDAYLAEVQAALSSRSLRVYLGRDLAGTEWGGCLKNVYAIAAGCCDGLRLGDNAKAALLTRALAEMVRLGGALGAQAETFYGLSGFGDLVATCGGSWSRNRTFGQRMGEGARPADIIAASRSVVEGYRTCESLQGLCEERGLDAPILAVVYRMLYADLPPAEALTALMTRELKRE